MITDYTTYDDVRAVLGVSAEDLEDATLALKVYSDYLEGEMEDVDVGLPDTYADIQLIDTPTSVEARFLRACSLFATYAVARHLAGALPLFAAKQNTDGKAEVQRFDTSYRDTIKSVNEQYGKVRERLIAAMAAVGTTAAAVTPAVYMSVVSPSYDPVTGV